MGRIEEAFVRGEGGTQFIGDGHIDTARLHLPAGHAPRWQESSRMSVSRFLPGVQIYGKLDASIFIEGVRGWGGWIPN